ncbi:hypothetical protein SMACR_00417 [Sordaria macrospora]|uniref:WGS project CABT00000000 data, contig 2.1 n=2 Tax=Sordaria macrospora TaxID=5147 RepID=F7VL23_SORMK|nr:uncharacterized protein SMAC_00417 [Sordaria macrospora k-hell]KAA8632643.1 hypothetical protein SMACR_00417 [Sordaria macrospora]WPJ59164.1 hypothetical protein SMAC4_00417 [Sordaria macrospora]CCC06200.1 unnamed protein product [Sordaria macrospora k-hell]
MFPSPRRPLDAQECQAKRTGDAGSSEANSSGVPASTPQPNGNVGVDHNSRRQKPETGTLLARWGLIMLHPWPRKPPDATPPDNT